MTKLILSIIFGSITITQVNAATCYVDVVKDTCWTNYNLALTVINTESGSAIASITVTQGIPWVRVKFPCTHNQTLGFQARYSPVIWQGTENQVYSGQNYWQLSSSTTDAQYTALCFGRDFSEVTFPVTGDGKCQCNMQNIPP